MRCAKFQLLITIITILLHLCCRWPPPRLAHDPTFMRSAQSCDFYAEKCCCSGKHQYKSYPFRSCYLVNSIPFQRNPSLNKCRRLRGISQKCFFLLVACSQFVQMLALALTLIKSVIIQRKRRRSRKMNHSACFDHVHFACVPFYHLYAP